MVRASFRIVSASSCVLVIQNVKKGNVIGGGDIITTHEAKDLNRARAYLADVAQRHLTPLFKNTEDACKYVRHQLSEGMYVCMYI